MRLSFTSLLLLAACCTVSAQFDTSFYTQFRVGEKLPPTFSFDKPQLLCFASESSCMMCMESLKSFESWVSKDSCISMTLFLASADGAMVNTLKSKYDWRFEVVQDKYGAIHTGFGVKHSPFYYLVDNSGLIMAMGPIASASDDWDNTTKQMNSLCQGVVRDEYSVKLIRSFPIVCKGKSFSASLQRQMQPFDDGKSVAVLLTSSRELFIVDSDTCRFHGTVDSIVGTKSLFSLLMTSSVHDSSIYLNDLPNESGSMSFHAVSNTLNSVQSHVINLDTVPYRSFLYAAVSGDGSLSAATLTPAKFADTNLRSTVEQLYSIAISKVNDESNAVRLVGCIEKDHQKFNLSGYYWQSLSFDGDSVLYAIQNLSDTVRVLDLKSGSTRAIPVCFDNNTWLTGWRKQAKSYGEESSLEFQKSLGDSSSTLHGLHYDEKSRSIYVSFLNLDQLRSTASYYLVGPVGNGLCRQIQLPAGVMPHSIHGSILYATTVVEGALHIQLYHLYF